MFMAKALLHTGASRGKKREEEKMRKRLLCLIFLISGFAIPSVLTILFGRLGVYKVDKDLKEFLTEIGHVRSYAKEVEERRPQFSGVAGKLNEKADRAQIYIEKCLKSPWDKRPECFKKALDKKTELITEAKKIFEETRR